MCYLQSDEALQKARVILEFTREMLLVPRNLAGMYVCSIIMYYSVIRSHDLLY